jgi:hypothetical protein
LLAISSNNMSNGSNFNRTRNNTTQFDRNRSNNSDFGSNRSNDSQQGNVPYDESTDVMFYLLTTLIIPSMICFLFLFYNFIRLPQLRTKPTNLLIICLLVINFIHVSSSIKIFINILFFYNRC